jgi:phosphopantetheinyl transferase (holo-ACP synthase)
MQDERSSNTSPAVADTASVAPSAAASAAAVSAPRTTVGGLGIAIESLASFPEASDDLAPEFYRARFTPAEIALCSGRESPRASFCALAAVKRAVLRSGAAPATSESLAELEITIDALGKPAYRDCLLSVDQAETIVVAACLWTLAPALPAPIALARIGRPLGSYPPLQRLGIRVLMALAGLSLLFVFGAGLWFVASHIVG